MEIHRASPLAACRAVLKGTEYFKHTKGTGSRSTDIVVSEEAYAHTIPLAEAVRDRLRREGGVGVFEATLPLTLPEPLPFPSWPGRWGFRWELAVVATLEDGTEWEETFPLWITNAGKTSAEAAETSAPAA